MANLPGGLLAAPIGGTTNPAISDNLRQYAGALWPPQGAASSLRVGGALSRQLPVSTAPRNLAGSVSGSYSADFYHRVHLIGGGINTGNISSAQVYHRQLWNAHLVPKVLGAIDPPDSVSVAPAAPMTLAGTELVDLAITVAAEGEPKLAGGIAFAWDSTQSPPIPMTGSRVRSWGWRPDWSDGIRDRLEWKTDITPLADGAEQRMAVRIGARRTYEFSVLVQGRDRRHLEAALWATGADAWAVPMWHDARDLAAPLPSGSGAIPMATAGTEFAPGVDVLVLGHDPRQFESLTVADVTPTHLLLANTTAQDWPAGSRVVPTRAGRLEGAQRMRRFTGDANYSARLTFELLDPWDGTPEASPVLYRGAPVLELAPEWSTGLELDLSRDLEELDSLTGGWLVRDRTGLPIAAQKMGWVFTTPSERAAWLRLLAHLRGRWQALWVPTWTDDFRVLTASGSGSSTLTVAWGGYAEHLAGMPGRQDIRLQLRNGTVVYRRIVAAVEVSSTAEQLTLDAPLGVDVQPQQVAQVSFLALCRNNADAAELSHWTGEVSRASVTWRTFRP